MKEEKDSQWAKLAAEVVSVDNVEAFTLAARQKLQQHGIPNVTLETGDAAQGWQTRAPYDVIVLTGSVPLLAEAFRTQLKPGGRLFAIVGEAPVMEATLVSCPAANTYRTEKLFELIVPSLVNAPQPQRFAF